MSAIIADDEQLAREELKFLLDQIGDVEVVAVAGTVLKRWMPSNGSTRHLLSSTYRCPDSTV